jgi:gliding motility-associated-like protein
MSHKLLFLFGVLLNCSIALHAQNPNFFIFGPEELCPGQCATYAVPLAQPGTNTIWQDGQAGQTATYCMPDTADQIQIIAQEINDNGVVVSDTLIVTPIVSDFDAIILSDVAEFCPAANQPGSGGSPTLQDCEVVCAGTTVTYTWEVLGQAFLAGVQINGASSFSTFSDRIEVEWGASSLGSVSLVFIDQCDQAIERNVCVEVLDNPLGDFITDPPLQNDTLYTCEGRITSFTNTSQFADDYVWNFGNGESSTEVNPSFAYDEPGVYELELRALNACECEDSKSITVIVEEGEVPLVDCVGTLCEGGLGTYTATSLPCPEGSLLWEVSDNGQVIDGGGPGDDFISVQWLEGPEGTVRLTVEGCPPSSCTAPYEIMVPILSDEAQIVGPEIVCLGEVSNYSITPYEGTSFDWEVSSFGTIIEGQGTPSVVVEWRDDQLATTPQWVAVSFDNCYLECGGRDTLEVNMQPEFFTFGPVERCQGDSSTHQARSRPGNLPVVANWVATNAAGDTVWTSSAPTASPTVPWDVPAGLYLLTAVPDDPTAYCTESSTRVMQVIAPPPAVNVILGDSLICAGQVYTYEAVSDVPGARFFWQINDGGSILQLQGRSVNVQFGASPPYAVEVYQENVFGCQSAVTSRIFNPVPAIELQGPADACVQSTTTFSIDEYPIETYNWSILPAGAGSIVAGADSSAVEIVWTAAGMATVQFTACGQTITQDLVVHPLPEPVPAHPDALCPGDVGTVQTLSAYSAYSWEDSTGTVVATEPTPDLPSGFYRLLVTDTNGCQGDTTFRIRAYSEPDISISTPDPNAFCNVPPSTRLFATDSEAGYDYQWLMDGMPVGTNTDLYTATDVGAYNVSVTDQNGCTNVSNVINVLECGGGGVSPIAPCTDNIDYTASGTNFCNERSYNAILSPNYVAGTIQWVFDDPESGTDNFAFIPTPSHTFSNAGLYRVVMIASFEDPNTGSVSNCLIWKVDTVYAAANFAYDQACAGSPTAFTDLSTFLPAFPIASWAWDFGDPASGADNTSTDVNPAHVYSAPGNYTATLTITSSAGCIAVFSQDVEVLAPPTADFEEPMTNCAGSALLFEAVNDPAIVSANWTFGDPASGGANEAKGLTAYHEYINPGTYTVTLVTSNQFGCEATFQRDITVSPNPLSGDIAPFDPIICEGDSVTLTAPSGGTAWAWSNGASTENITVAESGRYSVTLNDDNGCTYRPAPVTVDLVSLPTDTIRAFQLDGGGQLLGYVYDTLRVCEGEDVTLTSLNNNDYSYEWSTGATSTNLEFTEDRDNQLATGTYEYSLTVTDNTSSCQNTYGPFVVIVNPLPAPAITANSTGNFCEGSPTTFTVDSPDPSFTYTWSNGLMGTSMTTAQAGDFFVTATNEFGCEARSNAIEILPGPDISLVPNGCYSRCNPDTLCLPEIPGIATYQWVQDGTPLGMPSADLPELVATQSGSYWLDMVAENGCQLQSESLDITVLDSIGTFIGEVYVDVNENGIIDAADTTLNVATIDIAQGGMVVSSTMLSDSGGYAFPDLMNGDYTLTLDSISLPPGFSPYYTVVDSSLQGCGDLQAVNWLVQNLCPTIDTSFLSASGCDSVLFEGLVYIQDTSFALTYSNLLGCDSVVLVDLQVNASSFETQLFQACSGDSIMAEGMAVAAGDSLQVTYANVAGCDSVINIVVEALLPDEDSLFFSACPGELVTFDGVDLGPGDQQTFAYTNLEGCDSTVVVTVEALQPSADSLQFAACPGETVSYAGVDLVAGAEQSFTFTNAVGCDSVVLVQVEALQPSADSLQFAACPGETVSYAGVDLAAGAEQSFTFTNAVGCDSVVLVQVEALQPSADSLQFSACPGETINYDGVDLVAGTEQSFTFTNAVGCDSVVLVQVVVLEESTDSLTFEACPGESVVYNGNTLLAGSIQSFAFTNAVGCDSTIVVEVIELAVDMDSLQFSACSGEIVNYNGVDLAAGTTQSFTFANELGCDSIVFVEVIETFPTDSTLMLQACDGESVTYNGQSLSAGTQADFTFVNAAGCDSIVTVMVEAVASSSDSLTFEVCPGETLEYEGATLMAGETATFILTNEAGCDSVVTVSVLGLPPIEADANFVAACPEASDGSLSITDKSGNVPSDWTFTLGGGATQTENTFTGLAAGDYDILIEDENGCSSLLTVNVPALPSLEVGLTLDSLSCDDPNALIAARILSGADSSLTLEWSNGETGMTTLITQAGEYSLQVSNSCETVVRTFSLSPPTLGESSLLYLPNAFSPNDDGRNDVFRAYLSSDAAWTSYRFMVFDRWGDMLYETFDPQEGWDGVFRGELMNVGVYVYYLEGTISACGGQSFDVELKGDVTLAR